VVLVDAAMGIGYECLIAAPVQEMQRVELEPRNRYPIL